MKYSPSKLIEVILYNLNALCAILKLNIVPERGTKHFLLTKVILFYFPSVIYSCPLVTVFT